MFCGDLWLFTHAPTSPRTNTVPSRAKTAAEVSCQKRKATVGLTRSVSGPATSVRLTLHQNASNLHRNRRSAMRIRQYAHFVVQSETLSPEQITAILLIEPTSVSRRGSRSTSTADFTSQPGSTTLPFLHRCIDPPRRLSRLTVASCSGCESASAFPCFSRAHRGQPSLSLVRKSIGQVE
jgi:hypothetical protein